MIADKTPEEQVTELEPPKKKPIAIVYRNDASIEYADSFVVAHSDQEFIISFLQFQHPIALTQEYYDQIPAIEALCLARIAVTPKRMRSLIETLQRTLVEHEEILKKLHTVKSQDLKAK